MKTVAIIDPTSMVGSMMFLVLQHSTRLILVFQDQPGKDLLNKTYDHVPEHTSVLFELEGLYQDYEIGFPVNPEGPAARRLFAHLGQADAVINCATIVKPHLGESPTKTFFINSGLPHLLSRRFGPKLIHLSTDCVFSGLTEAPYTEASMVCPTDLYGLTRSLGEPSERSLVIRASTIGPEIHDFNSLVAWVRKQSGKTIKGFTRHLWNGVTTRQFATSVEQIIHHRHQFADHGLFHIFGTDVTKYDMVTAIAKKYHVDVTITLDDSQALDRRLRTNKTFNEQLQIPSFTDMMAAL